jgi:hypothetical protein
VIPACTPLISLYLLSFPSTVTIHVVVVKPSCSFAHRTSSAISTKYACSAKIVAAVTVVSSIVQYQLGKWCCERQHRREKCQQSLARCRKHQCAPHDRRGFRPVSEVIHGDSRELGSSVWLSFILVDLVSWDGGVEDGWLDSLLLNNWLHGLVDVVINVLA